METPPKQAKNEYISQVIQRTAMDWLVTRPHRAPWGCTLIPRVDLGLEDGSGRVALTNSHGFISNEEAFFSLKCLHFESSQEHLWASTFVLPMRSLHSSNIQGLAQPDSHKF